MVEKLQKLIDNKVSHFVGLPMVKQIRDEIFLTVRQCLSENDPGFDMMITLNEKQGNFIGISLRNAPRLEGIKIREF